MQQQKLYNLNHTILLLVNINFCYKTTDLSNEDEGSFQKTKMVETMIIL